MDFLLRIATTDALPREFSRHIWLLERNLNDCLAGRAFNSAKLHYAILVEAKPFDPLYSPKNYVKLDQRDGAVWSSVVGDFGAYEASTLTELINIFVPDVVRALRQVPVKFLLPEEGDFVIECFQTARVKYYKEVHGISASALNLAATRHDKSAEQER